LVIGVFIIVSPFRAPGAHQCSAQLQTEAVYRLAQVWMMLVRKIFVKVWDVVARSTPQAGFFPLCFLSKPGRAELAAAGARNFFNALKY